jgi:hypothetical protein
MSSRREAFQFFFNHAGGVGRIDPNGRVAWERARYALELARDEQLLNDAIDADVASIEWVEDTEPYDPGDMMTEDEARAKFESNEWTGPFGCIIECGDEVASLWGIVLDQWGTNDPYARVVVAEMAGELSDALRQAVIDARDAEIPCPLT